MLRAFVVLLGVVLALGGVAIITMSKVWPAGLELLLFGAAVILGTVFEQWRYRNKNASDAGPWELTGERFRDPISGTLFDVAYNPVTGERDYRPIS